jgi:tripartite-type tricarboxylate transporter receptor subunit TctC
MKVLQTEDVRTKLAAAGLEIVGNSPTEFAKVIIDDGAKWAKVIKDAGIKLE